MELKWGILLSKSCRLRVCQLQCTTGCFGHGGLLQLIDVLLQSNSWGRPTWLKRPVVHWHTAWLRKSSPLFKLMLMSMWLTTLKVSHVTVTWLQCSCRCTDQLTFCSQLQCPVQRSAHTASVRRMVARPIALCKGVCMCEWGCLQSSYAVVHRHACHYSGFTLLLLWARKQCLAKNVDVLPMHQMQAGSRG